jgi:cysteine synthase B
MASAPYVSTHTQQRLPQRTQARTGAAIEALVGNTPLLRLPSLAAHLPAGVELLAKAEWFNPGGSVKDRSALNIIRKAESRGDLRPGMTILDSTSGNMGIAYAMISRARGYNLKLVIPANVSPERLAILRAYGVDLVLSDPAEGTDGAARRVREIYDAELQHYFFADQFNNPDNWQAHYLTTGVEIWEQTGGRVTHFVSGLGTSGTLMGVGRRLREYNPAVRLISVQPDAPFHGLEGLKHMPTAVVPGIYDETLADENREICTEDAYAMCRRLAREDGVLVGVSAGAAMMAAMHVAQSLEQGVVVTLLPDSAAKYLSASFWTEA